MAFQGAVALFVTIAILIGASAAVGALVGAPIKFDDFLPPAAAACISVGIGLAGALASLDDVGKREFIGLATAAQVGLVPAWLGLTIVRGFDTMQGSRLLSYVGNLVIIVATSATVYATVRYRRRRKGRT